MGASVWTHGCDACDAATPVVYVPPLGYLCAECQRPEKLTELREMYADPQRCVRELGGEG